MRRPEQWLELHKDYPHEDWCLVWPFARESRVGRGLMGDPSGQPGSKWAHRIMCEMVHGPAPAGKPQAAHSCGNGDLGCVNPRHLSWASNSENQRQRYAQGRGNPNANGPKGRFSPEQIEEMRSLYGQMTQMEIAARFDCSLGTVQYYLKYREQRGHTGGKIDFWSPEEDEMLRRLIVDEKRTHPQVAAALGRSAGSISARACRRGLKADRGRQLSFTNGRMTWTR